MHLGRGDRSDDERAADTPSPDRAADWVGEAIFHGHIAVWSWPVEEVRQLLAPGLVLATPTPGEPAGDQEHPVLFVYGEQTRGANFFAGIPLRSGLAYHEAGLLIPFVRHKDRPTLLTFVPRMYASFFPPVWHDEAYYGLGKQLVTFGHEGPFRLCMSNVGRRLLLEFTVEPRGPWLPAGSCDLPVHTLIQRAAGLPIVGRVGDGSFVGSHFLWDFRSAEVREADSLVELHPGVLDGIPGRACPDVARGTLEVHGLIWRLGWPGRCEV
jgi:hypothetical protein